jgi:hypothetical protein
MFDLKPFRHAFLNPRRPADCIGNAVVKTDRPFWGQRNICQTGHRAPGVRHHLANLAFGLRIGVEYLYVPTVERKPCGPSAANNSAPDYRCCLGHFRILSWLIS